MEGYNDELKPKFKSNPTQFLTIIFASSDTPNVGDMSETKLIERQQKILNLIKESPTITGKQMSEKMHLSVLKLWNFWKYCEGPNGEPGLVVHFHEGVNVLIGVYHCK